MLKQTTLKMLRLMGDSTSESRVGVMITRRKSAELHTNRHGPGDQLLAASTRHRVSSIYPIKLRDNDERDPLFSCAAAKGFPGGPAGAPGVTTVAFLADAPSATFARARRRAARPVGRLARCAGASNAIAHAAPASCASVGATERRYTPAYTGIIMFHRLRPRRRLRIAQRVRQQDRQTATPASPVRPSSETIFSIEVDYGAIERGISPYNEDFLIFYRGVARRSSISSTMGERVRRRERGKLVCPF